jgi:hypothetical protein
MEEAAVAERTIVAARTTAAELLAAKTPVAKIRRVGVWTEAGLLPAAGLADGLAEEPAAGPLARLVAAAAREAMAARPRDQSPRAEAAAAVAMAAASRRMAVRSMWDYEG